MRDILKLSLILAIFCALAGVALAATYTVTSEVIAEREKIELQLRLKELIPMADTFTEVTEDDATYFLAEQAGETVGAVMVVAGRGYAGPINLLVSLNMSGIVQGVKVVSHRETAGIGDRVEEASFLGQFVGKALNDPVAVRQDIVAISRATVSSRGVALGVRQAIRNFNLYLLHLTPEVQALDLSHVADGQYQGQAHGYKSLVTADVTIFGGKITRIIVGHDDTPEYAEPAARIIPQRIIERQNYRVDAVTGATVTSEAIMEAVRRAIPEPALDISKLPDGDYQGEGEGFMGPIVVRVAVAGGKIVNVTVLSHSETPDYAAQAFPAISRRVIDMQSVEVDAVSGATGASQGLIAALTDALMNGRAR